MQTSVNTKMANGVVGEIFDNTPLVVDSYLLDGNGTVGYALTVSGAGTVEIGGSGAFAGILCNPKQYATDTLADTNTVLDGAQVSVMKKGRVWVDLGGTASVGSGVYFVDATGALGAGTATTGQTQIAGAEVVLYDATSNGLCVVEIY